MNQTFRGEWEEFNFRKSLWWIQWILEAIHINACNFTRDDRKSICHAGREFTAAGSAGRTIAGNYSVWGSLWYR